MRIEYNGQKLRAKTKIVVRGGLSSPSLSKRELDACCEHR